jgi:hypothetical protein
LTCFTENTDDALDAGGEELSNHAQKLRAHFLNTVKREGGAESDPQEVADKIYESTTSKIPNHNPVGTDAEMLFGMMSTMPRQQFLDKVAEMLLPPH